MNTSQSQPFLSAPLLSPSTLQGFSSNPMTLPMPRLRYENAKYPIPTYMSTTAISESDWDKIPSGPSRPWNVGVVEAVEDEEPTTEGIVGAPVNILAFSLILPRENMVHMGAHVWMIPPF